MGKLYLVFAALVAFFSLSHLHASTLSPVRLFSRCYSQLTSKPVPLNDPRLTQVKNLQLDPITACVQMLENTQINPSDTEGKLVSGSAPEQLSILQNFYKVTTSFVGQNYASRNLPNFFEGWSTTEDYYDFTSVGLAYTEAIFNPNRQFKELFTLNRMPLAKRVLDNSIPYPFIQNSVSIKAARSRNKAASCCVPDNIDSLPLGYGNQFFNFAQIQVGELTGISYNSPVQNIAGFDMNANVFPGIMNQRTYIMANANFIDGNADLQYMPRRLSRSIAQDFLCRDLPVLRESDITSLVTTDPNGLPFRKAASCVQCHAFMDQLASTYRGIVRVQTGGDGSREARVSFHSNILASQISTAETGWPYLIDPDFWKRPAKGKLFFRSLTKPDAPMSIDLTNGNSLGSALASTDDVHICFAKKMFKYFTGIDVRLIDLADPANASSISNMTAADYNYRDFVFQLGVNLKTNQNSKKMIEDILHSSYYSQSDFLTGGP